MPADLAEAAAIILADEGRFDGATPPLSAPDALNLQAVAGILTELTGRTLRRVVADDDEFTAGMVAQGVPTEYVNMQLGLFRASRRGKSPTTGSALEDLLRRAATPVRSILEGVAAPR
jgi:NAD(P)H dehydrogenase (quinone)